jgi:hypothetical protein
VVDPYADPAGVGRQIIDAIGRDFPKELVLEILGADLLGLTFGSPFAAGILEIADQFLLFRVDRDDWLSSILEGPYLVVDVFELGIAIRMGRPLKGLAIRLKTISQVLKHSSDSMMADTMALTDEGLGQIPRTLAGPSQGRLRIATCGRFDQCFEGLKQGLVGLLEAMTATT